MRLEQVTAKALKKLNGDRYLLCAIVFKRVDELSRGAKPLIDADTKRHKLADIALVEIATDKLDISKVQVVKN